MAPRCVFEAVAAPASPTTYDSDLCVDQRAAEARVRPRLASRYERTMDGSNVEVGFECDPVTFPPSEIVYATGEGHGGSLAIWHMERDGAGFRVVGFVHSMSWHTYTEYTYEEADRFEARVARGFVRDGALTAALATARPAATAIFREIEPPQASLHGLRATTSSRDFHVWLRVSDGVHALDRGYTGYMGSAGQRQYLGVLLASESLEPLVAGFATDDAPIRANERDVFVTRFLAAAPHFYEDFGWWVRERYVRLAGRFGTTALVPALLEDLRRGLVEVDARRAAYDKAPALDDAAKKEQTKSAAQARLTSSVSAVVRLTGFDPRRDEHGVRPIEDVARELVRACAR